MRKKFFRWAGRCSIQETPENILFAFHTELRKILQAGKYDVVHVNMLSAANIVPLVTARQEKVPVVAAHFIIRLRRVLYVICCTGSTKAGSQDMRPCISHAVKWLDIGCFRTGS